jgi:hypothetical protein
MDEQTIVEIQAHIRLAMQISHYMMQQENDIPSIIGQIKVHDYQ